ncbi:hypothetical protein PR048_007849 [Dryococelus australis]|uniref:Uncharacterized protein n=1 Tax=Dryococelus australis TaxID=614101 RepID=A0ABQ9HVF2_9NEOP|nr:hypothetical protein PR048_007849 [Dryococelus australis]
MHKLKSTGENFVKKTIGLSVERKYVEIDRRRGHFFRSETFFPLGRNLQPRVVQALYLNAEAWSGGCDLERDGGTGGRRGGGEIRNPPRRQVERHGGRETVVLPPNNTNFLGATVAERLARAPPAKANRAQSPAGSPDFRKWESYRTMPLVGGFSRGSPVSPAPSFRRCSIFTSIAHIGSNLFTHSRTFSRRDKYFQCCHKYITCPPDGRATDGWNGWLRVQLYREQLVLHRPTTTTSGELMPDGYRAVRENAATRALVRALVKENRVLFRIFADGNRARQRRWSAGFLGDLQPFSFSYALETLVAALRSLAVLRAVYCLADVRNPHSCERAWLLNLPSTASQYILLITDVAHLGSSRGNFSTVYALTHSHTRFVGGVVEPRFVAEYEATPIDVTTRLPVTAPVETSASSVLVSTAAYSYEYDLWSYSHKKGVRSLAERQYDGIAITNTEGALLHMMFDTSRRTLTQSLPYSVTAENQCAFDIGIFVHKTVILACSAVNENLVGDTDHVRLRRCAFDYYCHVGMRETWWTLPVIGGFALRAPVYPRLSFRPFSISSSSHSYGLAHARRQPLVEDTRWPVVDPVVQREMSPPTLPRQSTVALRPRSAVCSTSRAHLLLLRHWMHIEATVVERFTKANRVQSPASLIFACGNRAGRCLWSEHSLGDLLFPPPLHSGAAPYSPESPSSALKTSIYSSAVLLIGQQYSLELRPSLKMGIAIVYSLRSDADNAALYGQTTDKPFQTRGTLLTHIIVTERDVVNRLAGIRKDPGLVPEPVILISIWVSLNNEVFRVDEGGMRREWSSAAMQGVGEAGDRRENSPTSGIVRHDFRLRESGS